MKKLYIQPQTDLVRMANGEPVMEPIGGGLAVSTPPVVGAPTRRGNSAAVMYI